MGSVSSPFFCKSFQLSMDYGDVTNCFYVLYRIQIQIQMLHMTKSFIFKFLRCKPFVRGSVLKSPDLFYSCLLDYRKNKELSFMSLFHKYRDS